MCPVILIISCTPAKTRFPDLQPTLGTSETLGSQTPVPPGLNRLQHKSHLLSTSVSKLFPGLHRKLWRTVTEPRTSTLLPDDPDNTSQSSHDRTKMVPYLTFPTIVGKNSAFHNLTQEQLEELGGIEFRALNMLMWAVPFVRRVYYSRDSWPLFTSTQYYFLSLVIPFVVLAPYMSHPRWADIFLIPNQHRNISPIW